MYQKFDTEVDPFSLLLCTKLGVTADKLVHMIRFNAYIDHFKLHNLVELYKKLFITLYRG